MKKKILNYIIALSSLLTVFFVSFYSGDIWHSIELSHEHEILAVFFPHCDYVYLSSLVYHVANLIKLPSFVVAIF